MPRSHPPSLRTLVLQLFRERAREVRGARVLVAISGGPDSVALLSVLALVAGRERLGLVAHGVDHGLRPEAARELELASEVARGLGVPFGLTTLRVPRGGDLQARARKARYEALRDAARDEGCAFVATGHTRDDRAETVLLRLLRGAGPRGLGVLPALAESPVGGARLVRPLLLATRRDVLAHVARHGLPHAADPSNEDRRFLRARVRHEVLPLLEALSPEVRAHLAALADALGPSADASGEAGPRAPLYDPVLGPLALELDGEPVRLGRGQLDVLRSARRRGRAGVELTLSGAGPVLAELGPGGVRLRRVEPRAALTGDRRGEPTPAQPPLDVPPLEVGASRPADVEAGRAARRRDRRSGREPS